MHSRLDEGCKPRTCRRPAVDPGHDALANALRKPGTDARDVGGDGRLGRPCELARQRLRVDLASSHPARYECQHCEHDVDRRRGGPRRTRSRAVRRRDAHSSSVPEQRRLMDECLAPVRSSRVILGAVKRLSRIKNVRHRITGNRRAAGPTARSTGTPHPPPPDEAERSWVLHLGTKLPQTLEIVVDHNPDELRKRN